MKDSNEAGDARRGGGLQTLDRALSVMEALAAAPGDASLAQLAAQFPWHKSTTHRLLKTMAAHGYVEQDAESHRYRLGLGILKLSSALDRRLSVRDLSREPLRQLTDRTRETSHIAMLDHGDAVILGQAETAERVRIITYVGMRMPCHCTALGKVLLAHLSGEELAAYFASTSLERFTAKTMRSAAKLEPHLERVRAAGYALDDGEYDTGMSCLAAPVRDRTGQVVVAVGVSGPTQRMKKLGIDTARAAVVETGQQISGLLGYLADG